MAKTRKAGTKKKKKTVRASKKELLNEASFLLSEKRTYLSISRTGLAVVALAFTALAFLLTTENYHGIFNDFKIASVIVIGFIVLIISGVVTFLRAERKVARINGLIEEMKTKNSSVKKLVV